jgi:hypothetical protein
VNDPDGIVYDTSYRAGTSHGAGIIVRRALGVADGKEAKAQSFL